MTKTATIAERGTARGRAVLGRPDFIRLLLARVTSHLGDGLFMAVILHTVVFLPERQSTLLGFALATALTLLPFSFLEPFAGVLVDRWRRRRVLAGLSLLRAAAILAMLPFGHESALVYLAMLVVFSANRLFHATALAVTPRVLDVPDLSAIQGGSRGRVAKQTGTGRLLFDANAIAAIATSLALFGGMVVGGRVVESVGVTAVALAASGVWLVSAVASRMISTALPAGERTSPPLAQALSSVVRELGDGLLRIGRAPSALAPILTVAVGQFLQVLVIAVSMMVIKDHLDAGIVTFSWLLAAGGAGVFAGYATVGFVGVRMSNPMLIGAACLVSAVAALPALVSLGAATLAAGAVLLGVSYAWVRVPADTMAQQAVPDEYRGRVFTVMDVAFYTSRVLGAAAAVVVVPLAGASGALLLAGVLFLVWAPVTPFWLRPRGSGNGERSLAADPMQPDPVGATRQED